MVRLFSWLSAIAILMIFIASLGIYWLTNAEIAKAKHDSATAEANALALGLSSQINLLNSVLDKMAQDPEVLAVVAMTNPNLLKAVEAKLEKHLPHVLKIRLLLPGVSEVDETTVPRMGFADLEMVQDTFIQDHSPSIQGDKGLDRHLAIARRITQNNQVIGVILASLDDQLILKNLKVETTQNAYLELRQAALVLGSLGTKISAGQNGDEFIKVANTDWEIHYQFETGESLGDIGKIIGTIIVSMLIILLAFFVGYRKLSEMISQDLQSLMGAFKDIMTHHASGNYPVQLTEMKSIISTLMQFKRVLDKDDDDISPSHDNFNLTITDDEYFDDDDDFEIKL